MLGLSIEEFERAFSTIKPTPSETSQVEAIIAAENAAREHYYLLNDFSNPYCHIDESVEFNAYEAMAHYLVQQTEFNL